MTRLRRAVRAPEARITGSVVLAGLGGAPLAFTSRYPWSVPLHEIL
jgi:hypothetical protein